MAKKNQLYIFLSEAFLFLCSLYSFKPCSLKAGHVGYIPWSWPTGEEEEEDTDLLQDTVQGLWATDVKADEHGV